MLKPWDEKEISKKKKVSNHVLQWRKDYYQYRTLENSLFKNMGILRVKNKHLMICQNLHMQPRKDHYVLLVHILSFGIW